MLGDIIEQYLIPLMNTFAALLKTAPNKVKAVVIGAIGSTAHASKEKFLPYFEPIIKELVPFLMLEGEGEEEELRGIAMDACGTFAESVPKEAFLPYYEDLMKNAYQGVGSKSARLRECSFLFFGVMASMFPEKFVPYLANVVPAFLTTLKLDELGDDPTLGELRMSCSVPLFISSQSKPLVPETLPKLRSRSSRTRSQRSKTSTRNTL